jgi:hypothetical protein
MTVLFARIELRGDPGQDVYEKLHDFMESFNWYRDISGVVDDSRTRLASLPHATYRADFTAENPNVFEIATTIRSQIEGRIWNRAAVLVIQAASWGMTGD